MRWFKALSVFGGVVLITSLLIYWFTCSISPAAGLEGVGLGVEFNAHATPVWIALHAGLFKEQSLNITTLLKFRTGTELAAAVARGEVDAGWACLGPILNLIDHGVDVRIVVKIHYYGYALVVNPGKVSGVSDLNNTVVYSTGLVNPTNLLLIRIQDLYGVRFNVKPVGDPQTLLSMLVSGQIDAAALPEHYVSVAEAKGMKVLLRAQDVWPEMPGSYLIVSGNLLRSRPDVVEKLVKVTQEAVRMIEGGEGLVVLASSKELGVDEEVALRSVNALKWNVRVDAREIQEYIDFMYAHGLLKNRLNATEVIAYSVG